MAEPWWVPVGMRIERYSSDEPCLDDADPERAALAEELADLADAEQADERERFASLLRYLPAIERRIVGLHLRGLTHQQIGEVIGVRHQAVSYRLRRAMQRLAFLARTGHAEVGCTLRRALVSAGVKSRDARAMVVYYRRNSSAEVARTLGISQSQAWKAISRGLEALREAGPRYARYVELYEALRAQPAILCDVATQPRKAARRAPPARREGEAEGNPVPRCLRDVSRREREQMRALVAGGMPLERVAERYELDPAYLGYVLFGEWRVRGPLKLLRPRSGYER